MISAQPPQYPGKVTVALFGKNPDLVRRTGNEIIGGFNVSVTENGNFLKTENNFYRIISTSDFFDEDYDHPDQLIIDFMALSDPGPRLFILAIDSKNTQVEKVVAQISRLQDEFGENVTKNVVIVLENWESYNLRGHIKEMYNIQMATMNDNLAVRCDEWCSRRSFQFHYRNYSHHVVRRRKDHFMRTSSIRTKGSHKGQTGRSAPGRPTSGSCSQPWDTQTSPRSEGASYQSHPGIQQTAPHVATTPARDRGAHGPRNGLFNMVLLGNSGTGKSASANTILAAGKPIRGSGQHFPSYPSSTPVTTKCEEKIVEMFGTRVGVVDTPDFFYEEERVDRAQLEECKRYCQRGQCVMLLVMQLGRFTDGERGILEKLEGNLGWRIRESTIVLFTHGEDLKGSVEKFIGDRNHLKHIVEACGRRYHVFKNSSRDSKQFKALFRKFPDMFPDFPTIGAPGMSCFR